MDIVSEWFEKNRKWLFFVLISTFVWGMAAHGYSFFDNNLSHDSLKEFHSAVVGNDIKVGLGRFLTPIYRDLLRSDLTMPWLIGILSLFWIGLTTFFVRKLFQVESKCVVFLIAGALTTNIAFSATAATYIHDLDCNTFAVMCAAGAALLWRRYDKGWLLGTLPVLVTLGIYQSDLFVTVALVVMVSILDLLDGRSFRDVFLQGLKAIAMVVLGTAAYFLTMKGYLFLSGVELSRGRYNSLDLIGEISLSQLPGLMGQAYLQTLDRLWNAYSSYPGILVKAANIGLLVFGIWALAAGMKKMGIWERLLCLLLVVLLPLLVNFIYVITNGFCHDLMSWSTWLLWVLALLLSCRLSWQKMVCMLILGGLFYGNVQFSNGMYMKKEIEYDAYLSFMTRVADRMETTEGYVNGETPVVIVGLPEKGKTLNKSATGFAEFWNVTGMEGTDILLAPQRIRYWAYFDYILGMPAVMAEEPLWEEKVRSDFATAMPSFPHKESVMMHDGILFVKLGQLR